MSKKLTLMMIAAFVPLFLAAAWLIGERAFAVTMRLEQQRALSMQTMLMEQLRGQSAVLTSEPALIAASVEYSERFGGDVIFVSPQGVVTGAPLPARIYHNMRTGSRCALLDTQSTPERYAIAEPIAYDDETAPTVYFIRDVSDIYALRDLLRVTFALVAALGVALIAVFSRAMAWGFTRPIRRLTDAAQTVAAGHTAENLPTARRDEIGTLARAFDALQTAVAEREQALTHQAQERQAMLDALAHEMRTPLCTLLGNARLMQQPIPDADRAEIADDMAREIKRLADMDGQLMKLTRMQHEPLDREPVKTLALLHETARRMRAQSGGVAVTAGGDPSYIMHGDRALLALLCDNLAVNAVRACSPGGSVTLTALPLGFAVSDTGCGMTPEQVAQAFTPFYKADKARTRALGGAGLGLTLCKRIAGLHGASLAIESAPGSGTRVTFTTSLQPVEDFVTHAVVSSSQEVNLT